MNPPKQMKEAPKLQGMRRADFSAGYQECELEEPGERMEAMYEGGEKEQKFGGFLTRNNVWDRI